MDFDIDDGERRYLLVSARETIAAALEGRPPRYGEAPARDGGSSALEERCGAFVTLHEKGTLRGCIGRMAAVRPLAETVRAMAKAAAFEDPRFPPLAAGELGDCTIEISALSPLVPCADPESVVVGLHGVYLMHRGRSAVLLPQVPAEQGWNREEYLHYLCRKAGLPPEAYRESGAELYTFTAVVFSEED